MACDVNQVLQDACDSGIGKEGDTIALLQIIAQLTCDLANVAPTPPASVAGYPFYIMGGWEAGAWADSTTTFFGGDWLNSARVGLTTYANGRFFIPKAGTVTHYILKTRIGGPGSAENVTVALRLNDATNFGASTQAWNAVTVESTVSGISQAVAQGDAIALSVTTPAWASNPSGARILCLVWVETA